MLDWPVEGALFDVQYDALWHPSWGQRPADMSTALSAARRHLARAPKMIPVWGHRYLPAGRGTCGYPVLSIWQTDIIIYGTDLANYIASEFFRRPSVIRDWTPPSPDRTPPPMVPFWSDFLLEDLRKPGRRSLGLPGSVGLEPADLAGAAPGHGGEQLPVTVDDPQRSTAQFDGDDLPGVGQADLDALAGDLDAAAAGYLPLDGQAGGPPSSACSRGTPVSRCACRTMLTAPACPQPVAMTSPLPRTFTTRAWSSRISGSGSQVVPVQCWCAGGMPCSKSVVRSTSPVIRMEPSTSRDGWRRSITSKPSPVSARLLSVGQSSAHRRAGRGGGGSTPAGGQPSARTGYRAARRVRPGRRRGRSGRG